MHSQVVARILQLNQEFYQTFAFSFSLTRQRLQNGILMALNEIPLEGNWLDLGCGNGALAHEWALQRRRGLYLGLDFSPGLLAEAKKNLPGVGLPPGLKIEFYQVDINDTDWEKKYMHIPWNGILAFAVLHHIPSFKLRTELLARVNRLLPAEGRFILSVWQYQNSPRLMARRLPWESIGIQPGEVDEGDTLIDWRAEAGQAEGAAGIRYVHLYHRQELAELAHLSGFIIVDEYESDGRSGNLALYQVWQKGGNLKKKSEIITIIKSRKGE